MADNIFDQFDGLRVDTLTPGPDPTLGERFQINMEAGQRQGTLLGSLRDASTEGRQQDRLRFDERYQSFPEWSGFLEGAAAFGGQLAGSAASVENVVPVGLGSRLVVASKGAISGIWARVFAGAVDAAAVNAVVDAGIQGIENTAGFREGFDPYQWALSTGAGAVAGGAFGGAGGLIERARGSGAEAVPAAAAPSAANPFDQFDAPAVAAREEAPPVQSAPEAAAPETAAPAAPEPAPQVAAGEAAPVADAATVEAGFQRVPDPAVQEVPARVSAPETDAAAAQTIGEQLSRQAQEARGILAREEAPAGRPAADAVTPEASPRPVAEAPEAVRRTAAQEFLNAEAQDAAYVPGQERKRPGGGTAADPTAEPVQRVRETAEALAKALDVTATRPGRTSGGSRVLGQFNTRTGVVRVRSMDDFDTLTHEYGHHIDRTIPEVRGFIKAYSAELGKLDYDPAQGRDFEGFAEFFRLWLTSRAYIEKQMPKLSAEFSRLLDTKPAIRDAVNAATDAYDAFMRAPSTVAVASTIVSARKKGWVEGASEALKKGGVAGTISDVLARMYTFLLDDLNPLQRAVSHLQDVHKANTGRSLNLDVSKDPYKLARMSRGAYAAGHMDIMYGVAPYRGLNPETPSLRDAIVKATGKPNALSGWDAGKVRDFGAYLWSRRAAGEWERFRNGEIPRPPDKLTEGDHLQNIADLEAANPAFAEAAAMVHEWNLGLWRKKLDAGLIDAETYSRGLQIRDYVPGLRDFSSDAEVTTGGRARTGGSVRSGLVRRFQGSKRDVINPLESLAADAYETAMTIARNDVVKALDRLAKTAGLGGGRIAEEIPASQLAATMVDPLEAVSTAAKNAGMSQPEIIAIRDALEGAIGDEKAAIFRPAMINEKGEPIVFWRDGGQLKALRLADGAFGKEMYRALTGMSQIEKNFWVEAVAMPARVMRLGITTSFDFIGANFFRDQAMAYLYYGQPFNRVAQSLKGIGDDLMGSAAARAYARVGGISGGQEVASLSKARATRDLNRLARKGWIGQRLTSFRGVLEAVEIAETGSRLGLFRTFKDEAVKRGLAENEAVLEAAWRARDYMDFDRRGSGMAVLAKVTPFLNAALQGTDKTARHMLAPLARKVFGDMRPGDEAAMAQAVKSWARVAALTVAGMSLFALMRQHEDHDEISGYTRTTHWTIKAGDKWLAIPKPFELAAILNLGEATFEAMVEKDPTAIGRWLDNLHLSLMPPSIIEGNPAIKSWYELRTNTNLFTGGDIVPEHLQGMEPFLQYTARTSAFSRQLGKLFNISPAQADHLILNHLASWGRSLLSLYDMAQPDAPMPGWDDAPIVRRFIKDAAKGSQSVTRFWELMGTRTGALEGQAQSYQALSPAERADYFAGLDTQGKIYVTASTLEAGARRLHPMVRARDAVQAIGTLRREMAGGTLRNMLGEPQEVAAAARTAADDILSSLAMAIARNSLVVTGEPGWTQREQMDEGGFYRELQALDPALLETLGALFAERKVADAQAVADAWPDYRQRLMQDGSQAMTYDLEVMVRAAGSPLLAMSRPKRAKAEVPPQP